MSALKQDLAIAPQEIFSSSTTQLTDLGARATTGDGRVFRYVSCGSTTALVAGKVYQSTAQDTTDFQGLGVSVAAGTNTTTISTGSSVTLAVNQLAGGILTIRSGTGSGYSYRIKSHPAASAATVTFTLEDPIQIAIPTTAVMDVTPNPYSSIIIAAGTLTAAPVGVAVFPIPANSYGWVQTRGLVGVFTDGAITVGKPATTSGTAGFLVAATGTNSSYVATAAITAANGNVAPYFVNFE